MKFLLPFLIAILCYQLTIAQRTQPILTLNTEMHTAKIGRISTDAAGKYVLTCSKDKTAKLWNAATGKLIRTFRPPIGEGDEGMLYAGAISPDGKIVLVGGWSKSRNHDIYIFNTHSGTLIRRIAGLPNVIHDLEFSPTGKYFVAALGGANGIRIYRTTSFALVKIDKDYNSRSVNIAFAPNGRLASVSDDGHIRLYAPDFSLLKKQATSGGKKPFSLAFSPNNQRLAVGYNDSPTLQILDANSLNVLYEPELGNANTLNQKLNKVTFSTDGQQLLAGGFYDIKQNSKSWWQIRIWENAGRGSYSDYRASKNTIMDIKMMPNRNILYAGTQPDWGILTEKTGEQMVYQAAAVNDFRVGNHDHLRINAQAKIVQVKPNYQSTFQFNVPLRQLTEKATLTSSFNAKTDKLNVTNWEDTYQPKLNGKNLHFLGSTEMCRSIDISTNEETLVFGAEYSLYGLDAMGKQKWKMSTQSVTWAVNVAANNQVVVSTHSDGTIRWHRLADGKKLLTLFVHSDQQRWILWTPTGYYDAAPGAEDLIGWHVNQGADREALFYPAAKFRDTYYRPDVIDRMLDTFDEAEALQQADAVRNRFSRSTVRTIVDELPPTVRILSPTNGTEVQSKNVTIAYSIQSPNQETVTGLKIQVDGRPVSIERGLKPAGARGEVNVTIPAANCRVTLIAENRFGSSEPANVDLNWQGQLEFSNKPNLYILAIGVADYDQDHYDLKYPDDDAVAFSDAMQRQEGLLYGRVTRRLLTNKKATKDNILDGLDWLVNETTQHDVAMIFFAGHGKENTRGTFYYLPVGADKANLRRTSIMKEEVKEAVATIAGKVLVFMDACHSGNLMKDSSRDALTRQRGNPDVTRIINELISAENGAIVFSSSMGRQSSLESDLWENGAFTKAVVEGITGKARYGNERKVTCKSLDLYITRRVKQLTGGEQSPTTNFPPNVEDFPIVILPE